MNVLVKIAEPGVILGDRALRKGECVEVAASVAEKWVAENRAAHTCRVKVLPAGDGKLIGSTVVQVGQEVECSPGIATRLHNAGIAALVSPTHLEGLTTPAAHKAKPT